MKHVIIGGGLAGLVAAYELTKAGERVEVLEALPRPGGMIQSATLAGVSVDAGAEAFATRGGGVVAKLCEELGLTVNGPQGQPHIWWPTHGAWPMANGILGIPGSLDDPALGVLSPDELAVARGDHELPPTVGAEATTVAELVRARLGEAVLTKLVQPVARGIYRQDPAQLPIAAFLPGVQAALAQQGSLVGAIEALRSPGTAAVAQPVGGMFRLIDELAARITAAGGQLRFGARVKEVRPMGTRYAVSIPGGEVTADRLILATPAAAASALLAQLGVNISVPGLNCSRQALLVVSHPVIAEAPLGSGLLLGAPDPRLQATALTHYSCKWPWARRDGLEVLRLAYPDTVFPDRELVRQDTATLFGIDLHEEQVMGFRSLNWDELPQRLPAPERDHIVNLLESVDGLDVIGSWLDGNGIAAVVAGALKAVA